MHAQSGPHTMTALHNHPAVCRPSTTPATFNSDSLGFLYLFNALCPRYKFRHAMIRDIYTRVVSFILGHSDRRDRMTSVTDEITKCTTTGRETRRNTSLLKKSALSDRATTRLPAHFIGCQPKQPNYPKHRNRTRGGMNWDRVQ